jgi:hypothetical protein
MPSSSERHRNQRRHHQAKRSRIFNYLPLLEVALLQMGLLGLILHFCHRLLSGATHLGLLVTCQTTSPIQRGIGRGNDPRALSFPLLSHRPGRVSDGRVVVDFIGTRAFQLWSG